VASCCSRASRSSCVRRSSSPRNSEARRESRRFSFGEVPVFALAVFRPPMLFELEPAFRRSISSTLLFAKYPDRQNAIPTRLARQRARLLERSTRPYFRSALPSESGSSDLCLFRATAEVRTYSITSSARASREAGISRPSAFAVLRLMTRSYLVGAWTGRSAGFSPLRTRST
jgi:hypothetical protein